MARKKSIATSRLRRIHPPQGHAEEHPHRRTRDFVEEEESAPKTMLYPRDPSLDPQLVWKGKDEQDREDLAVPVVPIYIQEKIHPRPSSMPCPEKKPSERQSQTSLPTSTACPRSSTRGSTSTSTMHHWSNRMILGDSLLVMTSLAEKGAEGQGPDASTSTRPTASSSAPTGRSAPESGT